MWFIILVVWSLIGMMILGVMVCADIPLAKKAEGFEMLNPIWIYNIIRVNWLGAFVIALFFNVLCPIGAIGYWLYKAFTVGRR